MSAAPPRFVAAALSSTSEALARLRRARVFHPRGDALHARLRIDGGDHPLASLEGERAAIVRTSRAIGVPAPLPDIWGIAIRIAGGDGPSADILLATTGAGPVGRHLLTPARRPHDRLFSSLLPFESASGRPFLLAARPTIGDADAPGDRIDLMWSEPGDAWATVGDLELAEALPEGEGQALRFEPWRAPAGARLAGRLNGLRPAAYLGSQRGRPDASQRLIAPGAPPGFTERARG